MNFRYIYWLLLPFVFTNCARQTSPTGGPKDSIPPTLIKHLAIPKTDQTNFKGNELLLPFSEMVILNNPKEQVIITPSIGKDYEIAVKKNKVIITLETPLKDSTTYTFNFREAVQDITEKNPAKNLQIAFSTGAYIDSLSIEGNVYDMLTGKPLEDVTIAAQPKNDTFNLFKHPSTYFTKSDSKGNYIISHLKPGIYYLFAIDDKNKNLVADSRNESYGFLSDSISLASNQHHLNVGLVKLDSRPLKISSARPYNTYFTIRFTKGLERFKLLATDSSDLSFSYGADQSNIQIYNTLSARDSLLINIQATDSIQNKLDTSLYVKFNQRDVDPEKFSHSIKNYTLLADKGKLEAEVTFSKPLKEVNFDSLFFKVDSLTTITFKPEDLTYDEPTRLLKINKTIDRSLYKQVTQQQRPSDKVRDTVRSQEPKQLNILYLGAGAFISIENDSTAPSSQTINPYHTSDLSVVLFQVKTNEPHFIVQLLDKDNKVVQQSRNTYKSSFEDLQPAEYQLRIIQDKNNNGKWDPGNYFLKTEPEKIKYYANEKGVRSFNLKTNWELGPLLITY
jgi:hypothetical protein